jgi:hypothetical protein
MSISTRPAVARSSAGNVAIHPPDDLVDGGADLAVARLARVGEPDPGFLAGQRGQHPCGGQLGNRRHSRRAVDLQSAGDPGGELIVVDCPAGRRGEAERHPLVLGGAGTGEDARQDGQVRILGLADDLRVENWAGHGPSSVSLSS